MPERTYRIGEAATLLNLKSYVLRFWETEFPQIDPVRTGKGQRIYSDADIALLKRIRHLLHERGLTIEGARRALAEEASQASSASYPPDVASPQGEATGAVCPPPVACNGATNAAPAVSAASAVGMGTGVASGAPTPTAHAPNGGAAIVRDVIAELESLRDLLAPGR